MMYNNWSMEHTPAQESDKRDWVRWWIAVGLVLIALATGFLALTATAPVAPWIAIGLLMAALFVTPVRKSRS
jgi:hypothetical protein